MWRNWNPNEKIPNEKCGVTKILMKRQKFRLSWTRRAAAGRVNQHPKSADPGPAAAGRENQHPKSADPGQTTAAGRENQQSKSASVVDC